MTASEICHPYKGKIAVVGAAMDEVIPIRHAENLFDSLPPDQKKMWFVPDAGHNSWIDHVTIDWWKEVTAFIDRRN